MNYSNISFFLIISIVCIIIFLVGCANPQPPSGGPPDTTPPVITEFFPENQTINFQDRLIRLRFNKYMDKSKVVENFTISPNIPVTYDWSGKVLEIELPEKLDTTVTYSISLGTEYTDLYNNKPESSFSLIFSAGSKIDSGFIAGKVYDTKPDGAYIYCYLIDLINPDTLNPSTTLPDYKIQLGSTGEFKIPALKDALYRIFAIRDQFRNGLYESVDSYGSSLHDIKVYKSKSEPTILKIGPPVDKTSPTIIDAISLYSNYYYVKYSEGIDQNYIFPQSFEIFTEDKSLKAKVKSAWINYENKTRIDLITDRILDTSKVWIFKSPVDKEFGIRDTSGNLMNDSMNTIRVKPTTTIDSSSLALLYLPFQDSTEYRRVNTKFDFIFNNGIDTSAGILNFNFINSEDSSSISFNKFINGNTITLVPETDLPDNKWFAITAELKNLHSYSNKKMLDTTFKLRFKTENFKIKGTISGTVLIDIDVCSFNKYLIIRRKNSSDLYLTKLNDKYEWEFKNIETGEYTAEMFCDVDGNGMYSFGNPFPFTYSEPFVAFKEEIKIKPRWTLENIILKVKDANVR
jgi:hypothetical protein